MNAVSVKPAILSKFKKRFLNFSSLDSLFYSQTSYACILFHFVIATAFLERFNLQAY